MAQHISKEFDCSLLHTRATALSGFRSANCLSCMGGRRERKRKLGVRRLGALPHNEVHACRWFTSWLQRSQRLFPVTVPEPERGKNSCTRAWRKIGRRPEKWFRACSR